MAPAMCALMDLVMDFSEEYQGAKHRASVLDFSDLEHYAVKLLEDENGMPSPIAEALTERYREIMIDEYQDVSEVQEHIFNAVSRDGNNLFMVGDVKQSIYRFRLADPQIFLRKYHEYVPCETAEENEPKRILLQENFRSRREIIGAVNQTFRTCMSPSVGEILYDDFPNIAMTGRVEPFFDAIIIDEAQDLSKACLTYLSRLVKEETQSIMILADAAQSIYTNGITWKDAGFAVHGSRSIELKQNYRNPVSVYKVASCIIGKVHDSEDFVNEGAECARRQNTAENEKVTIIHCGTQEKEREVLLKCLKYLRTTHPDCSVGILVKTNAEKNSFSKFLRDNKFEPVDLNLKAQMSRFKITSDIYMVTIHSAKGLEFDYVVILDVNESNFVSAGEDFELNDQIRKLLYTSLTRARKNAYIFSSEMEYSKMLDDIDKELIKMRDLRVKPQEGADNK